MSSVLDLNLENVQEPTIVPEGTYKVRLTSGAIRTSKKGGKYISASFEIVNHDEPTQPVFHTMMLPDGEEVAKDERRKLDIKRFCDAFELSYNIETGETDSNGTTKILDWKGNEAWAVMKVSHEEDYGDRNEIRRFIATPE